MELLPAYWQQTNVPRSSNNGDLSLNFSLKLSNRALQHDWRQPEHLNQIILPVAHEETKRDIRHMMASKENSRKTNKSGPEQDKNAEWGRQHKMGQQKAGAHCSTCGMAWWEGIAIHRECGKHVHTVMCRTSSPYYSFHHTDQDQVQNQGWKINYENVSQANLYPT